MRGADGHGAQLLIELLHLTAQLVVVLNQAGQLGLHTVEELIHLPGVVAVLPGRRLTEANVTHLGGG
jgi:hypothetical protein